MPATLKLTEFNDKELMLRINDLGDDDGYVTVADFARGLGLTHPNPHNCVGTRFGWMRRFGLLERDGDKWRLTPAGLAIIAARLNAATTRALDGLQPEQGMEAMLVFGDMYRALRTKPTGVVLRRAWRHKSEG